MNKPLPYSEVEVRYLLVPEECFDPWEQWAYFYERLEDIIIPINKRLLDFLRIEELEYSFGQSACHHYSG